MEANYVKHKFTHGNRVEQIHSYAWILKLL